MRSGLRCIGSSTGNGRWTSSDDEPVTSMIRCASSEDREFVVVADVDRCGQLRVEQGEEAADLVVDVGERACLAAVAEDRDRLASQRLDEEVRDGASVVRAHPRAVGVEDAHDAHVDAVVAVIRHRHRLGVPLGLVVHAAWADRVDVAPVLLGLRMHQRVAVDLRRRRQEEAGALGECESERVVGSQSADFQDLDRDPLEISRAGRTRQVHHDVDRPRHPHVVADIVLDEGEAGAEQLLDVASPTR